MAVRLSEIMSQKELRQQAEAALAAGSARLNHGRMAGVEALALLHAMASAPASAGDALKFLHELQVHQVELDMQCEQLERNRGELSTVVDKFVELYDLAPVGLLSVDHDGRIQETNLTCADLLGVSQSELDHRPLENFLAGESRAALRALLQHLADGGGPRATCLVRVAAAGKASQLLQVLARIHPGGQSSLLVLVETSAESQSPRPLT
jgi:PAS domain S-box-containing protein